MTNKNAIGNQCVQNAPVCTINIDMLISEYQENVLHDKICVAI